MFKKVVEYFTNLWYSIFKVKSLGVRAMREEYDALDIATWFIYKTNAEKKENQASNDNYEIYENLTHLKLQKLLYFAQGISLARNGVALFNNKIEAWEHGPVVKCVWNRFSNKGRSEITIDDVDNSSEIIRRIETDTETREVLNMTYDNFAIYTAWQLRNMTHIVNGPWYVTYVPEKNKEISRNIIREYFIREIME